MLPPSDRWFFMTGCQRSGTTLLRLVLECHTQVFCFDEVDAYRVLESGQFEGQIDKSLVGFKVPRYAEQLDAAGELWDFGVSERVWNLYHGQKILFLVREWRDVVASMLKFQLNRSWLETWAVPIIDAKVTQDPSFAQHWSSELQILRQTPTLAATGAFYWKYKSAPLLRYKAASYPVLGISYERFVAEPEPQLRRICDFLEIEFERSMLEHPRFAHREIFKSGLTVGQTDPKRAIDTSSVSQWSRFLDESAIKAGERIIGDLPERLAKYLG